MIMSTHILKIICFFYIFSFFILYHSNYNLIFRINGLISIKNHSFFLSIKDSIIIYYSKIYYLNSISTSIQLIELNIII